QLGIAMAKRVPQPAPPRGASIECRIYAEDAEHGFRPATGEALYLSLPGGPGVRIDTFLTLGALVGAHYDGLLAKLICWGEDREQARLRMRSALDEFCLLGITNTAAFLRDIVASESFRDARLTTRFLEQFFPRWRPGREALDELVAAAAIAASGMFAGAGPADRAAYPSNNAANHGTRSQGRSPWMELGAFEPWRRRPQ